MFDDYVYKYKYWYYYSCERYMYIVHVNKNATVLDRKSNMERLVFVIEKDVDMKTLFTKHCSILPQHHLITAEYFGYQEYEYIEDLF